ncbi:MAG TPA: patatin-like phospholipase family protein [Gemmataceae bacterium]|nr:patatin-like phospholipase family protein [Gemmataceae bacterium]
MDAHIVLAGGGVKGAVLAGCLRAVEDKGVTPLGFGGTSAGSIVALLASIGYSGAELEDILVNKVFTEFLDDGGTRLSALKKEWEGFLKRIADKSWRTCLAMSALARRFGTEVGLYQGNKLRTFLAESIKARVKNLPVAPEKATFDHLASCGCKPLRVVATDLGSKRAAIFGTGRKGADQAVVDAVRASASFPFVFRPVVLNGMHLTDGGLSSNLPAFLFEEEYRRSRTPTLAFDLVPGRQSQVPYTPTGDLGAFAQALLGSGLEASDVLLRQATPGVTYFPIRVPEGIGTFDFALTNAQREACFAMGYSEASNQLERFEPLARTKQFGGELKTNLIVRSGPPRLYEPVLRAVMEQLESVSADGIGVMRAHIMLLTGRASKNAASTRIVTYSIGMDLDPDSDLELDQDAGCTGQAWESGQVAVADLDLARKDPGRWRMSIEQHNKVPNRIKSMISVPIPGNVQAEAAPIRPIGTLAVDCETKLADTGWCETCLQSQQLGNSSEVKLSSDVVDIMKAWATVLGAMLP